AAGEVVGLRCLDIVHRVEHDHAFGNFGRVIAKLAAVRITPPDSEGGGFHGKMDVLSVISFPRSHAVDLLASQESRRAEFASVHRPPSRQSYSPAQTPRSF